jgi:ethanolamine permease
MGPDPQPPRESNLDDVVREVVGGAELRPDEEAYLKERVLRRPLRVMDIWAMGVGAVISGAYLGWNLGLRDNGPVALLVASLIVCLLYLTWVLALAELSVGMPYAGGPLAYGRRAFGPAVGFFMAWSMLLECQFATITIALGMGDYVAFLVSPADPSPDVRVAIGLATVAVFFLLQAWGVQEQSRAMMVMTWGAILGLVLFWIVGATHFSWARVWPSPVLPEGPGGGWQAVLRAVPYALWWLVVIEAVALAAEESHEPHRTIPRGIVWAQLTLIALVILTWLFACGALDWQELVETLVTDDSGPERVVTVNYPLAKAMERMVGGRLPLLFHAFAALALFGLMASFQGILFGTSRQAYALGRAGYLPLLLGEVHANRRTPIPALLVTSLITAGFVAASKWLKDAIDVALLVSTLTALIWYILAIVCLFVLRRRDPQLFAKYRTPLPRVLPISVLALAAFAATMYAVINVQVIPFTLLLYGLGMGYYWLWACRRIQQAAPEELAARRDRPDQEPQS